MVTIIDYGLGNLGSITNMLNYLSIPNQVASTPKSIEKAKKIILPGVGRFDKAMSEINKLGIKDILDQKALEEKIPILGICLGAQIMCVSSEEGEFEGLGWFKSKCHKFKVEKPFKVPHMGWNKIQVSEGAQESVFVHSNYAMRKFYFVHSYYITLDQPEEILFRCNYSHPFAAGLQKENLFAFQFHPEKSHKFGLEIFTKFGKL